MAKQTYTSESLEILKDLEPVQRRPGMYTDTTCPNHLACEAIDNSVDEAQAGHAKKIVVTLHKDGSLSVADDGRGMPVDIHKQEKVSGVELIMTRLHAGGKFSNKNYEFSGGLHGVGISVVNALSSRLTVEVKRGGQVWGMSFQHGKPDGRLKSIGTVGARTTGTVIHFWPEKKYFDEPQFQVAQLRSLLRAKAVLCSGLTIEWHDEAKKIKDSWCYENGLMTYLKESLIDAEYFPKNIWLGEFKGQEEQLSWAAAWTDDPHAGMRESYVNLVPTIQGGTHVNGFRSGMLDALRDFCEMHKLLPRGVKLNADDVWDCTRCVISVKMADPQFAGQIKERLSSRRCAPFVSGVIKDSLSLWLNQHVTEGTMLAEMVIARAQKRMRTAKKVVRKRMTSGPALPGKLADCLSQNREESELFLVEGDSAGGSAKQGRDKNFQAIMPLRGKILNTWEVDVEQILASQEVHDISVALGIDPGATDLSSLRYGKICILADADSDGLHIATLLCALFLRHFPALVNAGHVFVAMPPLYRIDVGKEIYYALDEDEKNGVLDRIQTDNPKAKINIQRFKGLGEMNPSQLRETTLNPETRRLVQLVLTEDDGSHAIMDMLLAKKRAADRRKWLETKGNLARL